MSQPGNAPPAIRSASANDHAYILRSWLEARRYAPGMSRMPFRVYESEYLPELEDVLGRGDTEVVVADSGGVIAGWLAFSRGRSVDTVHWVATRFRVGKDGPVLRRQGVMRSLLEAARLHKRLAYTFRGAYPRAKDEPRETSDVWITRWLASRGTHAVFVPYREWIK